MTDEIRTDNTVVTLNGAVVIGAERFAGTPREITQQVGVEAENNLEAAMYNPADSSMLMRIYPICDIDDDRDVDQEDIQAIGDALSAPASSPSDRRDADGDGTISVLDAHACKNVCTLPSCEVPAVEIVLDPPSATVDARGTQQFTAKITSAANRELTWSLTPDEGRISVSNESAVYGAPSVVDADEPQTVTVTATSVQDPTRSGSATVTLTPSVIVRVSPHMARLYASETVQMTADVIRASSAVTWSLDPELGTISASGLYTAPPEIDVEQTVQIIATSADAPDDAWDTAYIRLSPPVVVTLQPSEVTLFGAETQQFTATVTGPEDTRAIVGFSPDVGVLMVSGLYEAPPVIEDEQQ